MLDYGEAQTDAELYDACRRVFEASVASSVYQCWFDKAANCIDNYEGRQWGHLTDQDRDYMRERKMVPITINLIKTKIDNVTGAELQTRTKFKYLARSDDQVERLRADLLSAVTYWLQDRNDTSRLMTLAAMNARICGIGWHAYRLKEKTVCEDAPNPLKKVWDTRDGTPDLSRQGFTAEYDWYPVEEAAALYPDSADELRNAVSSNTGLPFGGTWARDTSRMLLQVRNGYAAKELDEVCIVRMQYRKAEKIYVTNTADGEIVQSFSRDEAEKLAAKKNDISERDGYRVYECHFAGSINLFHGPADVQLDPRRGEFLDTPIIYDMGRIDRVPNSLVELALDLQRLYNRTATKMNQLLAARQVVADIDAVEDTAALERNANSPDGVILKKKGSEVRFDRHEFEINAAQNQLAAYERQLELTMGIFQESLGQETNAQSGIAIQRRQSGTSRTHALFLDNLRAMKRRVGMKAMQIVRSIFTDDMIISITDDDNAPKVIDLSKPAVDENGKPVKDRNGNPVEKLNIKIGDYDLSIEETPDVSSQSEEARQAMQQVLLSGIPPEKWTPTLLEVIGIPVTQRKRFEQERQQLVSEQAAMKGGPQQQIGGNSPAMPAGGVPGQLPITGS